MTKIIDKIFKKVSKKTDKAKIEAKKENTSNDKISAEELIEKLEKQNQKIIPVTGFTDDLKTRVSFYLNELENLNKEAEVKYEQVKTMSKQLDENIKSLSMAGAISIDKEAKKEVQNNIKKYILVIESLIKEIEIELKSLSVFVQKELPPFVAVHKSDSDVFKDYILNRLKWTRKYIKKTTKNLNVSFSRFQFDLSSQIQQFLNLQALMKHMKKTKKS